MRQSLLGGMSLVEQGTRRARRIRLGRRGKIYNRPARKSIAEAHARRARRRAVDPAAL